MKVSTLFYYAASVVCSVVSAEKLFDLSTDSVISSDCCDLTYAKINNINKEIRSQVHTLVQEDYFKHYKFNLDMNCPFFECQSICFSPGCQLDLDVHSKDYDYDLETGDEKKGGDLGNLNEDSFLDSLCPTNNDDEVIEDDEWCEFNDKNGVIIDISRNPERFTGYVPTPERNIWGMIYQHHLEGECPIEQKVFYQIISGFHSSVSTHLSNEYYNNVTNNWEPNLELFNFKVGDYPERIANIYFNYALVTRSILKLEPFLKDITFNPHNINNDHKLKKEIKSIINGLPHDLTVFNEDIMFENHEIKEEFKSKFKNVTKLMDCVTCDRCRLWGKIQSTGYATALKILFENPQNVKHLTKNEFASLFNTFDRLTKSIESIQNFNYLNSIKNGEHPPVLDESEPTDTCSIKANADETVFEKKPVTVKDAFYQELQLTLDALKFIGSSYINLPWNLYNLMLYKMNIWWSSFIGDKSFSPTKNQEYLHNIVGFQN